MKKLENYAKALSRLEAAVEVYRTAPDDALYLDGLIQRFEFTFELAWKSLKEYLEDQGLIVNIASPRGVLKQAFAAGVISDDSVWNSILEARNLTAHVYDESTAQRIAGQIIGGFMTAFRELLEFYRS